MQRWEVREIDSYLNTEQMQRWEEKDIYLYRCRAGRAWMSI